MARAGKGAQHGKRRPPRSKAGDAAAPNARQAAFIREYLLDFNATQAAIRAGYSARTAESASSRLLRNVKVRQVVKLALEERAARVKVTSDEVLRELKRIGMSDPGRAFDEHGALLPLHKMPEDIRRAISSVEVEELFAGKGEERVQVGTLTKVKFWAKDRGLEMLGSSSARRSRATASRRSSAARRRRWSRPGPSRPRTRG